MPQDASDQPIIVVSGLPRSGTSLMMAMLEAGGIPALTDNVRAPDEDNQRGYYEYEPVKSLARDASWVAGARGKVVKVILTLLPHLPESGGYRVVILRRDLDETIASQRAMLDRAGKRGGNLSPEALRQLYEAEHRKSAAWVASRSDVQALEVSYNGLLADARPLVAAIDSFLGGRLDQRAMLGAIDPALYRQRLAPAGSLAQERR